MKSTTYAKGTPVTVPPCRMHADVPGVILSRHVLRERDSEPIVDYWIAFEDGELCLHPHADVEMIGEQEGSALMLVEVTV